MARVECIGFAMVVGCGAAPVGDGFAVGGDAPRPTSGEEPSSGVGSGGGGTTGEGEHPDTVMPDTSGSTPNLDVHSPMTSGDGPPSSGCDRADFVFVIDNSESMADNQANLVASFPGFIEAIVEHTEIEDYRILVVDTDAGSPLRKMCNPYPACCTPGCGAMPPWQDGFCADAGDLDAQLPCGPQSQSGCDAELGAGKRLAADATDCELVGGSRFLAHTQPELQTAFACVALVGTDGSVRERPMGALLSGTTSQTTPAGCNAGFVRDDAILVVTLITDEEDTMSTGSVPEWVEALTDVKHGDETAIVMLGLLNDEDLPGGVCAFENPGASNLRAFTESFTHGRWASVCESDYAPFFAEAVGSIDLACDEFEPAG